MSLPIHLMSNFPSVRPSLNLQFDSQPTPADMTSHLASVGATFSRASIGTYTDANGLVAEASAGQARPNYSSAGVHEGLLIEESRTNLVTSSEGNFTDWNTAGGASFTSFSAIAPDGTYSAGTLVVPSSGARLENSSISVPNGEHTYSVYLKSSSGSFSLDIRLMTGTTVTVTDEWQRFTVTETVSSFSKIQIRAISATGNQTLYIWGAQVEAGSFATSYIPTIPTFSSRASTATFFNSSGVLSTASTNVARTDHKYIDGEWVEAGLLLEGASTNLVTNSEDISGYTNFGSTDTASATTSPDNASNGTKIEGDGSQPQIYLASPAITLPSAGDYTISVFAKAGNEDTVQLFFNGFDISSGGSSYFDLTNGTLNSAVPENARIEDVGNGWYKCSVTATVGASDLTGLLSFRVTPSTSAFLYGYNALANGKNAFVYGFQLEAGSQPTSYIPTSGSTATRSADVYTTATKTRSADVCYIDGTAFTDFYNQEQGTWFFNAKFLTTGEINKFITPVGDTGSKIVYEKNSSNNLLFISIVDGTESDRITAGTLTSNQSYKTALVLQDDACKIFIDGSLVDSSTSITIPKNLNKVWMFRDDSDRRYLNGTCAKMIYFPRALTPDTQLEKLTQ